MDHNLAERQLQLRAKYDEKIHLERKQHAIAKQVAEHEKRKEILEQSFTREQLELHKMDRLSIVNVVRKWRGTHDEMRQKEFEEAALAELKLNEHEAMLRDLKQDEEDIQLQLQRLGSAEADWQNFLKEKEEWVKRTNAVQSEKIDAQLVRVSEFESLLKEIDEAIYAGKAADRSLGQALKKLKNAKDMSTWDTFLGGGMIVTMMKHDDLDKSENALHEAQLNLQRFEAELTDVQEGAMEGLFVERGSFVTFADYFFDDIFSEWSIHNRINDSIQKVADTKTKLTRVIGNLQMQRGQIDQGLQDAKDAYEHAVELY
ncbi:hypothetical protein MKY84_05445 [Chryseomicrobium sp. FSL W7-1435]|uniref:hypothetical protein n=1 Tax=Chryseomicrobium sp. FSL W7-1435 TaxID=2921704 RepID=UPI003159BE31